MNQVIVPPPVVLVLAGNDPSGGAGLCADIQALTSMGCHPLPVVTCITVQDTCNVYKNLPLSAQQVIEQAETVLRDISVAACKIGLLGSIEIIDAVQHILSQYPHMPVVLDPILAAGGGQTLTTMAIREAMLQRLLPLTYLLAPNSQEARILSVTTDTLDDAATKLLQQGCAYVCITGTHEDTLTVVNRLYGQEGQLREWEWPRLPLSYHGSGCTFAASVAGLIAQGEDIVSAVQRAQIYTWKSLQQGFHIGKGQAIPNRAILLE